MLGNWKEQQAVAGATNRFDAMAKVKGDDVFCRTLIEDFRTRQILFEFKNYADQVKPNLVYITESGFTASYTGWGCMSNVVVLMEYIDPDRPAEIAAYNMCQALGW